MIDEIIEKKSRGNPTLVNATRTKLILKGINPASFSEASPDDPQVIARVVEVAREMGLVGK